MTLVTSINSLGKITQIQKILGALKIKSKICKIQQVKKSIKRFVQHVIAVKLKVYSLARYTLEFTSAFCVS